MRFEQLLAASGVKVLARSASPRPEQAEVREVVADSRRAGSGSCFVAIRGPAADGHAYITQAAGKGASAVVCEDPATVPPGMAWAQVESTAEAAGPVAQAALGWPARKLTILGVTGTKGKTTYTYLARHILRAAGCSVALVGTIRYEFGDQALPAPNTTPGAVELAGMTAQMVAAGHTHLVMEISSHALDQHRAGGLEFTVAAFTNLSGDHMDYHRTMEDYLAAKARMFTGLAPSATAVLNRDDAASGKIAGATRAKVVWYGLGAECDLQAVIRGMGSSGTRFDLRWRGRKAPVASRLIGKHNVLNCLAAAGSCLALGLPLEEIATALGGPIAVPGRLQRVASKAPFEVVVDYAHTDDSLDNALGALRPLTAGKLIVLFGCGGDRDRTKRPRMARVAQKWADRIVLTSDNPRTERPGQILDDILAGFDDAGRAKLTVQPDRRLAIAEAIGQAGEGDVVVLAGKGHEDYQIIGTTKHHFDDVEVAAELLAARYGGPGSARLSSPRSVGADGSSRTQGRDESPPSSRRKGRP